MLATRRMKRRSSACLAILALTTLLGIGGAQSLLQTDFAAADEPTRTPRPVTEEPPFTPVAHGYLPVLLQDQRPSPEPAATTPAPGPTPTPRTPSAWTDTPAPVTPGSLTPTAGSTPYTPTPRPPPAARG